MRKKIAAGLTVLIGVAAVFIIAEAQTSSKINASVRLEKDESTGFFTLTISDPEGIRDFSLIAPNKLPYGGTLSCPRTFQNKNVSFAPSDFEPKMDVVIVDCSDNTAKLELPPLADGKTRSIVPASPPSAPEEVAPTSVPSSVSAPTAPTAPTAPSAVPKKASRTFEKPKATILTDVQYPVKELGNCQSEVECFAYCDDRAHAQQCLAFARAHNLISQTEGDRFEERLAAVKNGPGGCNSQESCEAFCSTIDHIEECVTFAEENDLMSPDELEEAKKVRDAARRGVRMPGDCKGRNECEVYCADPAHIDECIAFAEESGFIPPEELEEVRKILPLMKSGGMPGGCRSKESCEIYCNDDTHIDECIAFAEKAGLLSADEREKIEKFKKAGGQGPGGCRGRSCEAFCQKPENQKACFEWAKENGFLEEGDLQRMEEGKQQLQKALSQMPPEVKACVEEFLGPGGLEGDFFGGPEIGQKMQACFQQAVPDFSQFGGEGGGPGGPGGGFPEGFTGPGGCTSQEECIALCTESPEQCSDFHPPEGGFPGGGPGGFEGPGGGFPGGPEGFPGGIPSGASFVGPGGCATPEECIRYCKEPGHEEECNTFQTAPTTPYAEGRGPSGCGSVEECRARCDANPAECDQFISEETPSEVRCQPGFETQRDSGGNKYCNPTSCPEGQEFITDIYGRRACSPIGASSVLPSGQHPSAPASGEVQQQYQQQFEQQYQQQYQQQLQQQLQQSAPPSSLPPPPSSSLPSSSLLGTVFGPWVLLLR